jgi:hypothetical protein
MPLLAAGFAWALLTRRVRPRAWAVVVLLQAFLLVAGLAAMNTGEREEARVERIVPEAALEKHEERAGQFLWATGVTLGLAMLVVVVRRPAALPILVTATLAGTVVVAAAAVRVGTAGGELVYTHNAGAAYSARNAVRH